MGIKAEVMGGRGGDMGQVGLGVREHWVETRGGGEGGGIVTYFNICSEPRAGVENIMPLPFSFRDKRIAIKIRAIENFVLVTFGDYLLSQNNL